MCEVVVVLTFSFVVCKWMPFIIECNCSFYEMLLESHDPLTIVSLCLTCAGRTTYVSF